MYSYTDRQFYKQRKKQSEIEQKTKEIESNKEVKSFMESFEHKYSNLEATTNSLLKSIEKSLSTLDENQIRNFIKQDLRLCAIKLPKQRSNDFASYVTHLIKSHVNSKIIEAAHIELKDEAFSNFMLRYFKSYSYFFVSGELYGICNTVSKYAEQVATA